jgi:hypothetical protein
VRLLSLRLDPRARIWPATSKQAPHNVGCLNHFHGTYNPGHDNDHLGYSDTFTFKVEGDRSASLNIVGSFYLSPFPCSPTAC